MSTKIHYIDVGQGSMTLVQCADGTNFVVDCNITQDNQDKVLAYVRAQIGNSANIRAFICTHRDADHIRGIQDLHDAFPLDAIWDSDYPGTTTDTPEYKAYMQLRRKVGSRVIKKQTRDDYGRTRLRYLSAKDERLPKNANAQGVIVKVEHRNASMVSVEGSTTLPGDSDAATWKDGVLKDYSDSDLSCDIFLAAHHGSISFFETSPDARPCFVEHLQAMSPAMTLISVGDNPYGHPDKKALELYEEYSTGSSSGEKVWRTDKQGTMALTLKDGGGGGLSPNQ